MPTTSQMLATYPDVLLRVLAELRGAVLDGADTRHQAIELLAAQITDPTSVQYAYQEVVEGFAMTEKAVELMLRENGEMNEAQFSREFGSIRQMGPAKLERESPWLYPESMAEVLYYYGLLGRGFKGAGQQAHAIVYIPSDVIPWLPQPQVENGEEALPIKAVPPPPKSRTIPADSSFLEDMGTLLGFIHSDRLRLTASGPHPEDVEKLVERLQLPFSNDDAWLNTRLALMLHLANRLGWLRRSGDSPDGDDAVELTGNRVRIFLEKTRPEQRLALWSAWYDSPDWNDLCRTPGLECANTRTWKNDPLQTRKTILNLLGKLQADLWYSQTDVIGAIKEMEPDFQRSAGNYDTWYIRNSSTQEFLKGFAQWEAVEGTLLGFLLQGPLHWLDVFSLAEPSSGDDMQVSLTAEGARWLGQELPASTDEPTRHPIQVGEDFTITLALSEPLSERFRVERFANWSASYPQYVYKINKRSLQRAAEEGITAQRVLDFLKQRSRNVPEKVATALARAK